MTIKGERIEKTPGFIKQNRSLHPGGPNDSSKLGKKDLATSQKLWGGTNLSAGISSLPKRIVHYLTATPERFSLLIIDMVRMETGVGSYNFPLLFYRRESRNSEAKSGVRSSLSVNLCDRAFNLTPSHFLHEMPSVRTINIWNRSALCRDHVFVFPLCKISSGVKFRAIPVKKG